MSSFDFISVEKGKTPMIIVLSWFIARQHYVVARVSLQQGLTDSGCLLAEQSIEMFIKSILNLQNKSEGHHILLRLLRRGRKKFTYFDNLLNDKKIRYFFENLDEIYFSVRFGEGRADVKSPELIQVLDEVAFNLDKTYREEMVTNIIVHSAGAVRDRTRECPLYVPDSMKEAFLLRNKYFSEKDISNDFMAKDSFQYLTAKRQHTTKK
jgi:HEPN domain-containing protein